ncbi:hypothetical protein AVEN_120173-1 [Araneus ventricosus]|uniref:Uncharacterized protein n=1 Tax=Araneus ventricosus TaxID=182803 RepID=A0A4Y2GTB4_ARAVE|nr:hypothetical protein AVEN_120173-1 [Araneus ventricosus]
MTPDLSDKLGDHFGNFGYYRLWSYLLWEPMSGFFQRISCDFTPCWNWEARRRGRMTLEFCVQCEQCADEQSVIESALRVQFLLAVSVPVAAEGSISQFQTVQRDASNFDLIRISLSVRYDPEAAIEL